MLLVILRGQDKGIKETQSSGKHIPHFSKNLRRREIIREVKVNEREKRRIERERSRETDVGERERRIERERSRETDVGERKRRI
jgi:hypothetical protein